MSIGLILLIIAFVLFLASAIGVPSRINLCSLGLALWALSILIGSGGIH